MTKEFNHFGGVLDLMHQNLHLLLLQKKLKNH
jgi:hypothetical protein